VPHAVPHHPSDDRCDDELIAVLRAQPPARKLATLDAMWSSAVDLVGAGVRAQHPTWDDALVSREVARRMAGHAHEDVRR